MNEPVCWSWPVPAIETVEQFAARVVAENERVPFNCRRDPAVVKFYDPDRDRFDRFHAGRCALCGWRGRLVEDHCHDTGQVRGRLCPGCNVIEGRSSLDLVVRYRSRHPAAILQFYEPYHDGIAWINGWSQIEHRGDLYCRGPRPLTPWPTLEES